MSRSLPTDNQPDEDYDPEERHAHNPDANEVTVCPTYSELSLTEDQTMDFRDESGIVINLQHASTPHFLRSVIVGTMPPILSLQYSSDRAFFFAEDQGIAPEKKWKGDEDEEVVPTLHTHELEPQAELKLNEPEKEQPPAQLPMQPSSFGYHLLANYHFGISAVRGTASFSWKPRYKLQIIGLSIPPGFATPSCVSAVASYVGESYAVEAEYDSKDHKTEFNCTTLLTPFSWIFGNNAALFAGSKVVSTLPFQNPNYTSVLHFATSTLGVVWNVISKFDVKSAWSLSFTHNFGVDGLLATFRWKKTSKSRVVSFATGLSLDANPISIKMKIDQAEGIACGLRSPFFLGQLQLSLSYLTTGQSQGLGFGAVWDIIT